MWKYFSAILLRNKLAFASVILIITGLMVFKTTQIKLSYEFAKILPEDDSTYMEYMKFKKMFGEDGNVMVLGIKDKNLFEYKKFSDWHKLSTDIKALQGIRDVLSLPTIYKFVKNDSLQKFEFHPILNQPLTSQTETDSIKQEILNLPFYDKIIYNQETGATLIAITFNKKDLDSKRRISLVNEIRDLAATFSTKHNVEVHYSGMPYIRSMLMTKVSKEMTMFLALAVIVTALILWLFFRTGSTVLFSLLVVIVGVFWSMGIMELFGYKITILSGLIAPLIMVIGLPNCIFLINKYQSEFLLHGNKIKALTRMIETIGVTLFLANITTAIGFGVLYFTKSSMLVEFGLVSSISVMATYFITLILIPIILYYLPTPKAKHTKHQEGKRINKILDGIDNLVQHHRTSIYVTTSVITIIFTIGTYFIDLNGYVVDDLPKNDPIYTDLHFFEENFNGVLPFEMSIDTKKENGVFADNAKTIYKIKALQKYLEGYQEFSKPVSIVEGIKFSNQAYHDGNANYYRVPSIDNLKTLSEYSGSLKGQNNRLKNFIDSTKQVTRVSYQVADIGSKKMEVLVGKIKPTIDSIFPATDYKVSLTGHSLVFLKNNDYLLSNLIESLIIEILLIALVGIALFRSVRIIVLSKIPCLIPLVITAGVMGFLGIRFKPSTILIFSIAFGISSDGTIYFLTKYRQELKKGLNAAQAISAAIHDTGLSMIYTSVILFSGFAIFAASSFGGTVALGILVSLTLIISMFTNLILLPAILLSIHNKKQTQEIIEPPLIDIDEEEDLE